MIAKRQKLVNTFGTSLSIDAERSRSINPLAAPWLHPPAPPCFRVLASKRERKKTQTSQSGDSRAEAAELLPCSSPEGTTGVLLYLYLDTLLPEFQVPARLSGLQRQTSRSPGSNARFAPEASPLFAHQA